MCLSVGRTPPLAQPAAAGRSAGIHFKSSVQRQPEDSSARRVGLLFMNTLFNHRLAPLFSLTLLFFKKCSFHNENSAIVHTTV